MENIKPVALSQHGSRRWKRYTSYLFAAEDMTAPLVVAEFSKACMAFPIAFLKVADGYSPVAVLGLMKGKNLFVSTGGQWIGGYVPAAYRGYPFRLGVTKDNQRLLCVDEGSGLVVGLEDPSLTSGVKSELFFDDTGAPSEAIKNVIGFLSQVDNNRDATSTVCDLFEVHKLIVPWPITLKSPDGERAVEGLFKIDEEALRSLKAKAVTALHKENALLPAYCQILSMQTFPLLGRLIEAHAKVKANVQNLPPPAPSGEIDFSFLSD